MTQDSRQAQDDIAFIKGFLGDDGRAPIGVAHVYLLVGLVFFLAAVRQFCLDIGWNLPMLLTAYSPWDAVGLFLVGFAISSTMMWRKGQGIPDDPRKLNPAARAALAAWGAVSFGVLVGAFSLWLASDVELLLVSGMILLAVCYSVGWSVTFAVHRVRWHRYVAWGFIAWAVAIGAAAGSPWLTLVFGVGLLLLFGLPGYRIIAEAGMHPEASDPC